MIEDHAYRGAEAGADFVRGFKRGNPDLKKLQWEQVAIRLGPLTRSVKGPSTAEVTGMWPWIDPSASGGMLNFPL